MEILICLFIGYLLGSASPAALVSKRKGVDLRKTGSGNLGATNTMLVMGPGYGLIVMVIDVFKSIFAAKIAQWLFPKLAIGGLTASLGAIVGHVFPFYMRFQGGKGLAAFAGLILAHDWVLFLILLAVGMTLMLIVNYSYIAPMSVAVLLPFFAAVRARSKKVFWVTAAASTIIVAKHWSNIGKALRGEDIKVREYIRDHLLPRSN